MKFKFNGTIEEFINKINNSVNELNLDDLDIFNNLTKMEVRFYGKICKILLDKYEPNEEFWYVSRISEENKHVIIDGKIKDCRQTKKDKIMSILIYIFFWPIILIGWLLNEYTPFHAAKYRKNRLKKLMIKYMECEEIFE